MERLTYWNNKEKGSALPVSTDDGLDTVDLETICAKLAAYEDTGLEPKDIWEIAKLNFQKEYYTVDLARYVCEPCGGTGVVEIKGKRYCCPKCNGHARIDPKPYSSCHIYKWRLCDVHCIDGENLLFTFRSETGEEVIFNQKELGNMKTHEIRKFYAEYEEAKDAADRVKGLVKENE